MNPFIRGILGLLIAGLLSTGCVTVESGQREVKVDEAVTSRVAAGLQYLQQGDPAEARRHFSRALQLDDNSAVAHNAMALLYKYEQDPEMEEYHYKKAVSADRSYSPAQNNYGTLLFSRGDYEDALKRFERAANDASYSGRGSAWENIGRCYQKLGRDEEAQKAFIKALRLNPRAVVPNIELADLYFKEGRARLAWDYYQQYAQRTDQQGPRSLLLGAQLAATLGFKDQQSSYALALENLYRRSPEFREWQKWTAARESAQ
ncbi:type IV pilus biogenesis/stability protein PilW [Alcanivorax sp. DP30]|uniref:type IV pilus biogenesis/stability protein PilW n=1 Tax=Alcanivorax sp. DP30 TaxID=2606217 RepID=UPI00136A2A55|nr:type IV pilus biogenesis/stability protein PilW [Alcanivorax sp. DP30]MZR63790.1 type IV pilus biogenesis/stability protein PilW [Alcanivorax sp. DP30]